MSKIYAVACKGLADPLVGAPLEILIVYLNQATGIFFNLVGGLDPRPLFEGEIVEPVLAAHARGEQIVFLGHSMGAMAAFYLADRLKREGIHSPLFIAIDATNWASNAPGVAPWTAPPATTPPVGHWYAPDNIDVFYYFHQLAGPGGGVAELAHGNTHTRLHVYKMAQENHISIVNAQATRSVILGALTQLQKTGRPSS
jgi:pimeloyl-ACP methyl ester carboxylesterase